MISKTQFDNYISLHYELKMLLNDLECAMFLAPIFMAGDEAAAGGGGEEGGETPAEGESGGEDGGETPGVLPNVAFDTQISTIKARLIEIKEEINEALSNHS